MLQKKFGTILDYTTFALCLTFLGFVVTILLAMWNVSNRLGDKIENTGIIIASKFDVMIEKMGKMSTDILIMTEVSRPHKTVNFSLEKSGLTGIINTRTEDFTSKRMAYTIVLSEEIRSDLVTTSINKLNRKNLIILGHSGRVIIFKIKSLDLDENASILVDFLKVLDNELSDDTSKDITLLVEDKLRKLLAESS